MFKFKLNEILKDRITSFAGVVVARTDYLTGCNRYSLQSKELYKGCPIEWQNFDENQLKRIKEIKEKEAKIKTDKIRGGVKPVIKRNYK